MASLVCIFFIFNIIILTPVLGEVVYEDGYSVKTVIDGNKIKINPHSIISVQGGAPHFIILDSSASTFYTVSYNKNSDFTISKLTGSDTAGYVDGSLDKAKFNKPKSFAVDSKGNIYVADVKNKHAIRKISQSGVTTIAGGYSQKPGRADGPALNASFSDDFELSFVPERCTLMISDHGSRLVREIQLKAEDCSRDPHTALRAASTWFLTVGLPCLVCLILGLVIRPYVIPNEHGTRLQCNTTWKRFQISLERQVLMFCFDIRSVIVDSTIFSLLRKLVLLSFSHLCLMFSPKVVVARQTSRRQPAPFINFDDRETKESANSQVIRQTSRRQPAPLINLDDCETEETSNSQAVPNILEDLITFDGMLNNSELTTNQDGSVMENTDVSVVDRMILSNMKGFAEKGSVSSGTEASQCILALVNQKKKVV